MDHLGSLYLHGVLDSEYVLRLQLIDVRRFEADLAVVKTFLELYSKEYWLLCR